MQICYVVVLVLVAACSSAAAPSGYSVPVKSGPDAEAKPDYLVDPLGSLVWECEHNDGKACTWVGHSYEDGDVYPASGFVPQDYVRANRYYKLGCTLGHPEGCYRRGLLYQAGRGVRTDATAAKSLFQEACSRGNSSACSELSRQTPEERIAAINAKAAEMLREKERAEAAEWKFIPTGSEWHCFDSVSPEQSTDRTSFCYRSIEECSSSRERWMSTLSTETENFKKSKVSQCNSQRRAACFHYVWRMTQRRGYGCFVDFTDCEHARSGVSVYLEIEGLSSECRGL